MNLHVVRRINYRVKQLRDEIDQFLLLVQHFLKFRFVDFRLNLPLLKFYLQCDSQKRCWHHFPANVAPNRPTRFHDYQQAHKYGRAHPVFYHLLHRPLVHTAVRPCHVNIGTHIDHCNSGLDRLNGK